MFSVFREAAQAPQQRQTMTTATSNAHGEMKGAVIAQMRTVYVMAQEALPTVKLGALINLQIDNVSSL